jgi:hypothetical protein
MGEYKGRGGEPIGPVIFDEAKLLAGPSPEDLAASIGCEPGQIIRTVRHARKSEARTDGRSVYTSFVDQGDPENVAVFETVWPA